jgi:acyl carrier protein
MDRPLPFCQLQALGRRTSKSDAEDAANQRNPSRNHVPSPTRTLRKIIATALMCLPVIAMAADHLTPAQAKKAAAQSVLHQTAENLGIRESQVALDTPFANQISPADELDLVEIIMAIEEDLGITIEDDAMGQLTKADDLRDIVKRLTVRQLQDYVATRRESQGAP